MANTYLSRTPSSAGNRQTWTISAWVKRGTLGTYQNIVCSRSDANNALHLCFTDTDQLMYQHYLGGSVLGELKTNRKFRDNFGWYNVVVTFDSTNGTAGDRQKMWINGVEETSFATDTNISQNQTSDWNDISNPMYIGQGGASNNYWTGSMSYVAFIDGTAEAPSIFGETDSTTGEWKIKTGITPSSAWGTNGFLILKDGNTGTDQSTNSNNFTVGGGTLTKTEDCPDNVFATLDPLSPQNYTFSNGNNTIYRAGSTGQSTALATLAPSSGKWYWEVKLNSGQTDYPRIGIYEMNSDNHTYTTHLGNASNGTGKWWGSGNTTNNKIANGNDSTTAFHSFTNGDILMFAMDNDNGKLWFGKNGTWYTNDSSSTTTGSAISNNTATPAFSNVTVGKNWTPAVFGNAGGETWQCNFGNGYFGTSAVSSAGTNASGIGIFEYDVPTNFTALSTKGLNE